MHIEPEPNENIAKLLALKKFEKPPPRYFEDFSGHVIARIEAEDTLRSMPWWERITAAFDLRPAFMAASALLISAGMVLGVAMFGTGGAQFANQTSVPLAQPSLAVVSGNFGVIDRADEIPSSTTPMAAVTLASSPFSAQRVTFSTVSY
jgi:hypothetical protein